MSEVLEATKKGLKKVADFFEIIEVGEAHHSAPYPSPPKGSTEVSLVATNTPTTWGQRIDRRTNIKDPTELGYAARIGSGGRTEKYW